MKKKFITYLIAMLFSQYSFAQNLIIKGKIKCMNQHENSSKGAENVIIVPAFSPPRATVTLSSPSGYFEFNTGISYSKLQDKTVAIYAVSRCSNCKELTKRIFISEDQDRQNRNDVKKYVTIKDWMLKTNCQKAELQRFAADSVLNVIAQQPAQDIDHVTAASALVGTPAFLNFLSTLIPVVGATGAADIRYKIQTLHPGKIHYGEFLLASSMFHSPNKGFNFSPSRDLSEAVFWNSSAIGLSRKQGNISLLTNLKNEGKLSAYAKLSSKFSLGGGIIFNMQDEFRRTTFVQGINIRTEDSMPMKLYEFAAYVSPVYVVNEKLSVGASIKLIGQHFNIPDSLICDETGKGDFVDSNVKKYAPDADLSLSYKVNNAFQLGLNVMNIADTKLYQDAFRTDQVALKVVRQRSFGLGATYKWKRFHFGVDLLANKDGLYDMALGANMVPFNNALISTGIALKQMSYSLAFRMKHFRIAYINDNGWTISEKREGKLAFVYGKIYGGFVIDLN